MILPTMLQSVSCSNECFLGSSFLQLKTCGLIRTGKTQFRTVRKPLNVAISVSCSAWKVVRSRSLDKHVVKQNKIRFVQKLTTLLLSKPKHFLPLHILAKCRDYLCVEKSRSIISMIHRYPCIFELFTMPMPPLPLNATKSGYHQCVRLTPAAAALATEEMELKSAMSLTLANKLQKLLMLSSHRRLLLSKLVHLAPDLGLPVNFRSRLCTEYPEKFKTVDTSYGRALELVTWDPDLAVPLKLPEVDLGLIVDRPLKFKQLRLRKGLNLKRQHQDFLLKFGELSDVCPYTTSKEVLCKTSVESEKRACGVVREVLGMTVEKRTLIDHLTHFRKEFGLSNKLRAMIVRHPDLFYVSLKGMRDSVFLVEGYDDKGALIERDQTSVIKDRLVGLVAEGKRMRRQRKRAQINGIPIHVCNRNSDSDELPDHRDDDDEDDDDYDDGFDDLFDSEDSDVEYDLDDDSGETNKLADRSHTEFWSADTSHTQGVEGEGGFPQPW